MPISSDTPGYLREAARRLLDGQPSGLGAPQPRQPFFKLHRKLHELNGRAGPASKCWPLLHELAGLAPPPAVPAAPRIEGTWSHLPNGDWGVLMPLEVEPGATVHVRRKDGHTSAHELGPLIERKPGGAFLYALPLRPGTTALELTTQSEPPAPRRLRVSRQPYWRATRFDLKAERRVHVDGGTHDHERGGGAFFSGQVLINSDPIDAWRWHVPPALKQTNNVAEYMAVIAGLEWLARDLELVKEGSWVLLSDSAMVVRIVTGDWSGDHKDSPHLGPLRDRARALFDRVADRVRVLWVPRSVSVEILGH